MDPLSGFAAAVGAELWDELSDGLMLVAGHRIIRSNRAARSLFGYPEEALRELTVDDLLPSHLRASHRRWRSTFAAAGVGRSMDPTRAFCGMAADGSPVRVGVALVPVESEPEPVTLVVVKDLRGVDDEGGDYRLDDEERERMIQTLYAAGLLLQGSQRGGSLPGTVADIVANLNALIAVLSGREAAHPPAGRTGKGPPTLPPRRADV